MRRIYTKLFPVVVACVVAGNLGAQSTETPTDGVKSQIVAIGYLINGGATKIDLTNTAVIPQASGEAEVEGREDGTLVEAKVANLAQPWTIAPEFLTYVLWAVSPDGRTNNLGEILINDKGIGKLKTATHLQTFSLFVTAEPYHSVRWPSELVVLKNEPRKSTAGKRVIIDHYTLMRRSQYEQLSQSFVPPADTKNIPLQMYEAQNAFEIARSRGAEKYAPEIYAKAKNSMSVAENLVQSKGGTKEIISAARQTMEFSEDARALAADRQEQQTIAMERHQAADTATSEAVSQATAQEADLREKAEGLRQDLLKQLNLVLETQDTPRGLVVNMADVLFDSGKYNLNREAREKLAKLSGILAIHPGLQVDIEGHTDTAGGEQVNQLISEKRAEAVGTLLAKEGIAADSIQARGLGSSQPVADNSTAKGRQQNRRVEIILSGEVIGTTIDSKDASEPARISN